METKEKTEKKDCMSCLYLVTHEKCDGCLRTEEDYKIVRENMTENAKMHQSEIYGQEKQDPPYRYLNWARGNGLERGYQFEKQGKLNIVIGGMGEAEVNTRWTPETTLETLINVAEQCGYYVYQGIWCDNEKQIEVMNHEGHFRVVFTPSNDKQFKLNRIEKITRNDEAIVIWE